MLRPEGAHLQSTTTNRAAFTLIELIVVVAGIAILAAILFPVFAQGHDARGQIIVISDIKRKPLGLYVTDYDDVIAWEKGVRVADAVEFGYSNDWFVARPHMHFEVGQSQMVFAPNRAYLI